MEQQVPALNSGILLSAVPALCSSLWCLFGICGAVQQSMAGLSQCSDLAVGFAGAPEHREAVGSVQ